MFLKLRIIFTIISALFAAATLPVGTWLGLTWAISCAVAAGIFFVLMLICKQEQEKREPPQVEEYSPSDNHTSQDEQK